MKATKAIDAKQAAAIMKAHRYRMRSVLYGGTRLLDATQNLDGTKKGRLPKPKPR
jgi:hypothetical protein